MAALPWGNINIKNSKKNGLDPVPWALFHEKYDNPFIIPQWMN